MRTVSFKIAIVLGTVGICTLVALMWRLIDTNTNWDEPLFTKKTHEGRISAYTICVRDEFGWRIHFDIRCNIIVLLDDSTDKSEWPHPESTTGTAIFLKSTPIPFAISDSRDRLYVYTSDRVLHAFPYAGDAQDTLTILHSRFVADPPAGPAKLSLREEMAKLYTGPDELSVRRVLGVK